MTIFKLVPGIRWIFAATAHANWWCWGSEVSRLILGYLFPFPFYPTPCALVVCAFPNSKFPFPCVFLASIFLYRSGAEWESEKKSERCEREREKQQESSHSPCTKTRHSQSEFRVNQSSLIIIIRLTLTGNSQLALPSVTINPRALLPKIAP